MAIPKRVWSKNGKTPEQVIGSVLIRLDEQIMAQAILAADGKPMTYDVKELMSVRSALADVLKRKQGDKVARQAADRERKRRRALEGDAPPDSPADSHLT